MFAFLFRGRKAPPKSLFQSYDAPIRLDEARFAAWALALGETRPAREPRHRSPRGRRGTLPDVDMDNVVPAPSRPSMLRRFITALRSRNRGRRTATGPDLTGDPPGATQHVYGRGAFGARETVRNDHHCAA